MRQPCKENPFIDLPRENTNNKLKYAFVGFDSHKQCSVLSSMYEYSPIYVSNVHYKFYVMWALIKHSMFNVPTNFKIKMFFII